jgi:flagellar hook-associated protein 3 FlgL
MRITNKVLVNNLTSNLSSSTERLYESETQVVTGKKLNKPSDNPTDTITALNIRTKLTEIEQYTRNISSAKTQLTNTETVVTALNDIVEDANTLTIQGASDNYSAADKDSLSYEIDDLLEQVYNYANSTSSSSYIFSGTQTDTSPYQAVRNADGEITSVKTTGTGGDINYVVGENISIKVNVNGEDLFESGTNIFDTLISIRDDLRANNTDALTEDLNKLSDVSEKIINIESIIGSRTNRVEAAESRAEDDITSFKEYLSDAEDIDSAEAILNYQQELLSYQVALQAGSRILQYSLADFLS